MKVFRHKNLVYLPITKNASTSYTELFSNQLKWQTSYIDLIDWEKDHVFSHLLHPYTRHLKGITTCLMTYQLHDLVDNNNFLKLLGTAVFDLHSYPLTPALGENVYKIDWLLLDHSEVSGDYLTVKLLESYDIKITENDIPKLNIKSQHEKALLDKINQIRDQNNLTDTLTYFYEKDVFLYGLVNQSTKFCEIDHLPWSECSWLNNYKDVLSMRLSQSVEGGAE
jgi:hypothetical protein